MTLDRNRRRRAAAGRRLCPGDARQACSPPPGLPRERQHSIGEPLHETNRAPGRNSCPPPCIRPGASPTRPRPPTTRNRLSETDKKLTRKLSPQLPTTCGRAAATQQPRGGGVPRSHRRGWGGAFPVAWGEQCPGATAPPCMDNARLPDNVPDRSQPADATGTRPARRRVRAERSEGWRTSATGRSDPSPESEGRSISERASYRHGWSKACGRGIDAHASRDSRRSRPTRMGARIRAWRLMVRSLHPRCTGQACAGWRPLSCSSTIRRRVLHVPARSARRSEAPPVQRQRRRAVAGLVRRVRSTRSAPTDSSAYGRPAHADDHRDGSPDRRGAQRAARRGAIASRYQADGMTAIGPLTTIGRLTRSCSTVRTGPARPGLRRAAVRHESPDGSFRGFALSNLDGLPGGAACHFRRDPGGVVAGQTVTVAVDGVGVAQRVQVGGPGRRR